MFFVLGGMYFNNDFYDKCYFEVTGKQRNPIIHLNDDYKERNCVQITYSARINFFSCNTIRN